MVTEEDGEISRDLESNGVVADADSTSAACLEYPLMAEWLGLIHEAEWWRET